MKSLLVIIFLFTSSTVSAQFPIAIHGSSQKAFYNNASEFPFISLQQHWCNSNEMPFVLIGELLNTCIGHIHAQGNIPYRAELKTKITLPLQIQIFHVLGGLSFLNGDGSNSVIWDDTNSTTPPNGFAGGDSMGIKIYNIHVTIDPEVWRTSVPHGWVLSRLFYREYFRDGRHNDGLVYFPFFMTFDTSLPERDTTCDGCGAILRSELHPEPGGAEWGAGIVEVKDALPILGPLTSTVVTDMVGYNYGNTNLQGKTLARCDIDLHNGIEGRPVTFGKFDPVEIGSGTHRCAYAWKQDSGAGGDGFAANQTLVSLIVVDITVPGATATCQDPLATNFGQPLPCTYPVVPPPDWHNITGVLQRLNDQIRICDPLDSKCLVLGTIQ